MKDVLLGLLSLVRIPAVGSTQQSPNDWKNVQVLAPDSGIFVKTKAGQKYHGDLVEVTDKTLRLYSDEPAFPGHTKKLRDFRREDIGEVRLLASTTSTLAGAALGGELGAGIINGKLYLNYNKEVQELFLKDPSSAIEKADQNWPKLHK